VESGTIRALVKRGLATVVLLSALVAAGLAAARPDAATRPRCLGAVATKVGTKFSDVLRGTPRRDVIVGLGGPDIIIAGGGNDLICGGPGQDRVDGGPGNNRCAEAEIRLRCGPVSARIVSATASGGSRLELVADRTLSGTAPTDGFGVTVNGAPVPVRSAARSGRRVVLSLATPAFSDDAMSVAIRETARRELRVRTGTVAVANRNPTGCSFLAGTPAEDHVSEGPTNPALFPSSLGTLRAVFLSFDFPDATAGTRPVADGQALADWADDISYGRLALAAEKADHWFRMPDGWASYGLSRHSEATTFPSFVTTALSLADSSVDFSRYDAVFLLGTAPELPETAFTVPRGRGIVLDGVEIRFVAVGSAPSPGSLNRTPESLGRLLGLPHLEPPFLGWDPMREGVRSFTAWHKRKLGWVDPEQVRCVRAGSLEVQLSPMVNSGGTKAVVVPTGPTTGLVVENRYPVGYDASSCLPGALVYAVEPTTLRLQPAGTSSECAALFGVEAGQQASYQSPQVDVTVVAERERDLLVRVTRR
jgi:RTX calcium-binding nonapeptide repeat (4 copies)